MVLVMYAYVITYVTLFGKDKVKRNNHTIKH